jgi:hypothetical protein
MWFIAAFLYGLFCLVRWQDSSIQCKSEPGKSSDDSISQNDIWQAQSWASVQYDLSWKILHHYMKTVYQSLLVSAYQYDGYIGVYVVNDNAPSTSVDYVLNILVVSWDKVTSLV